MQSHQDHKQALGNTDLMHNLELKVERDLVSLVQMYLGATIDDQISWKKK